MKNLPSERVSPICLWCNQPIKKLEHEATLRGDGRIALVHAICRDIALANEQAIVEAEFRQLMEDQKKYFGLGHYRDHPESLAPLGKPI